MQTGHTWGSGAVKGQIPQNQNSKKQERSAKTRQKLKNKIPMKGLTAWHKGQRQTATKRGGHTDCIHSGEKVNEGQVKLIRVEEHTKAGSQVTETMEECFKIKQETTKEWREQTMIKLKDQCKMCKVETRFSNSGNKLWHWVSIWVWSVWSINVEMTVPLEVHYFLAFILEKAPTTTTTFLLTVCPALKGCFPPSLSHLVEHGLVQPRLCHPCHLK